MAYDFDSDLSSSQFPSAAGLSSAEGAFRSRGGLYDDIMARRAGTYVEQSNIHIERGNRVAPYNVTRVENKLGLLLQRTGEDEKRCERKLKLFDEEWLLSAHPDGIIPKYGWNFEGKAPATEKEEPKPSTICQVQGCMWVCGPSVKATLVSHLYDHNNEVRMWIVWRSEAYINWLLPQLDKFLTYVKHLERPPRMKPKKKREPVPPVEVERIDLLTLPWSTSFLADRIAEKHERIRDAIKDQQDSTTPTRS